MPPTMVEAQALEGLAHTDKRATGNMDACFAVVTRCDDARRAAATLPLPIFSPNRAAPYRSGKSRGKTRFDITPLSSAEPVFPELFS